jgi:enolase
MKVDDKMRIIDIKAREILDSRGYPTIEVDVILENNSLGRASIPSGASKGLNEAWELRDNDERFKGKGVENAIFKVLHVIKPAIIGKGFNNQQELDEFLIKLDNTENKSNLGANSILAVSLGYLKACANYENKDLYEFVGSGKTMPRCMMNVLNGGMHADNSLEFQEFMVMPNRDSMKEQVRIVSEVFHSLKELLKQRGYSTNVGDEGGFAPNLKSNEEALEFLVLAIEKAGYIPEKDVLLALDVAASSFYDKDQQKYLIDNKYLDTIEMIDMYKYLVNKYPIFSIEDPLDENDFEGFALLTEQLKIQIVGDDLFTTNSKLLQKGIEMGCANAILIKANQIGTITETINTINLAKQNNYRTIISHRSGETEDTFIADLAVGLNLGQIKSGSICRGERVCKYNRLLRIEELLK